MYEELDSTYDQTEDAKHSSENCAAMDEIIDTWRSGMGAPKPREVAQPPHPGEVTPRKADRTKEDHTENRSSDTRREQLQKAVEAALKELIHAGKLYEQPMVQQNGDSEKTIKKVEIANGKNDLSDEMGKGATLERATHWDELILSNGYKILVGKYSDGADDYIGIRIKNLNGKTASEEIKISSSDKPFVAINDGKSKTMIKVSRTGHIEAVRTNGITYKFVSPDLPQ